ncbi:MAG: hypothetical protein QOF70_4007 [Acetobacteraceae bacterium]|nr:hypothetical protein [Acetobacteraceae bacterium]
MSRAKNNVNKQVEGLKEMSTEELKANFAILASSLEMMLPNVKRSLNLSDEDWEHLQRAVVGAEIYGDADGINAGGAINAALRFVGLLPNDGQMLEQDVPSLPRSRDDMISDLLGLNEAEREKARSAAASDGQTIAGSLRQSMLDIGMI